MCPQTQMCPLVDLCENFPRIPSNGCYGTHIYFILLNAVGLLEGLKHLVPHQQYRSIPASPPACQHLVLSTTHIFANMMDDKCQHIHL